MTKKLAFLGYGLRSKTMLQAFREIEADISVAAVADPRWEQIKEENAALVGMMKELTFQDDATKEAVEAFIRVREEV